MKLLSIGLGYSASFICKSLIESEPALAQNQVCILGTNRFGKNITISGRPIHCLPFSEQESLPPEALNEITHVLISVPPSSCAESSDFVYERLFPLFLSSPTLKWVGYLSSTAVYGDHQGAWVDENTCCTPNTSTGIARLENEKRWLRSGLPVHIFRLSGIYGPGRSFLDRLLQKKEDLVPLERIYAPGIVFSRAHVDDIAQTVTASMQQPNPGQIYNVADDFPASSQEIMEYSCDLIKIKYPPLVPPEESHLSDFGKAFYSQSKKVSNQKIKDDLGVQLKFPTYKEGLGDIMRKYSC